MWAVVVLLIHTQLMCRDVLWQCQPLGGLSEWGHANQSLPRSVGTRMPRGISAPSRCAGCKETGGPAVQRGQKQGGCCEPEETPASIPHPVLLPDPSPPSSPAWHGAWLCSKTHASPQLSCISRPPPPARVHTAGGFSSASPLPKGELSRRERNSVAATVAHAHRPPQHPLCVPQVLAGPAAAVATPAAVAVPRTRLP